jgi:uncharacterized protein (TIGR03790 family)
MVRPRFVILVLGLQLLIAAAHVSAQTGDNILLVTNAASQPSQEIADYYAKARAVPDAQILRLDVASAEEITRRDYETKIEHPIAEWLWSHAAQDRILYIVLTKDTPLRIAGTSGANGTVASVDSELAFLYRKMSGLRVDVTGRLRNPLFVDEGSVANAPPFTHKTYDMFLVGRLDGYTVADVKALIDRGLSPSRQGTVVLDGKPGESPGNKWLTSTAAALKPLPGWADRVALETGERLTSGRAEVIGFYTWGSNAADTRTRHFNLTFLPGAIGAEFVSTDARTFKEPPENWVVNDSKNLFAGTNQSLIGDLIRDGITGVAGHVAEPFLNGTIRPDILFPAYARGFNLIESFYLAMPSVSWQTVVVGDPLCAPFGPRTVSTSDWNPPVDPATELPAFFSARKIAVLTALGAKKEAAPFLAQADARLAKKDFAAARQSLEEATKIDPDYLSAQLDLALLYQQAEDWERAIDRYQRIIEKSPTQAVALNNLANALVLTKNDLTGALPLARRAYLASVKTPVTSDTLAWIYHLMGDDAMAEPIMTVAAQRAPDDPVLQLHAAFILAGTGKMTAAAQHLDVAIRLDPSLDSREDVTELRKRLRPTK